jgi:hypothetical protein
LLALGHEHLLEDSHRETADHYPLSGPYQAAHGEAVKADLERRRKEVIGVRVTVSPVARSALDCHTGTSQTSNIRRLLDKRK